MNSTNKLLIITCLGIQLFINSPIMAATGTVQSYDAQTGRGIIKTAAGRKISVFVSGSKGRIKRDQRVQFTEKANDKGHFAVDVK